MVLVYRKDKPEGSANFSPALTPKESKMTESIADLEDALLRAMLLPSQSIADLANACGWRTSKVHRVVKRLEKDKLVSTKRGVATLTEAGKTVANEIKAASDYLATRRH
jgi:DNA-binding MarR family transcriptional regulator